MQNWYEHKSMKKYLDDEEPYPYNSTKIKVNSRIMVVAPSGAGKTNALINYIALSPNTFAKIIVAHKEQESLYQMLQDKLKGSIQFITDLRRLPTLTDLRRDMDDKDRILLVFDDWVNEIHKYPQIGDYFIRGRKKKITCFFLAQSYYKIPKIIRQQLNYLLLFKLSSKKDLDLILSDYSTGIEPEELKRIYYQTVNRPMNFFKIACGGEVPDNERYSSGFTDFIHITTGNSTELPHEKEDKST